MNADGGRAELPAADVAHHGHCSGWPFLAFIQCPHATRSSSRLNGVMEVLPLQNSRPGRESRLDCLKVLVFAVHTSLSTECSPAQDLVGCLKD